MSALEQWLTELLLKHGIDMLRVEAAAKARVLALLVLMQKDLVSLLANADTISDMGKADKNALLRESNALIAKYYGEAQLAVDLFGVADVEALGVKAALAGAIGHVAGAAGAEVRLGVGLPTENYLSKLAGDTLVQGSPAKDWWLRQQLDTGFKLANQIRIGAAQGETNAQIIQRLVGQPATVAKAPAADPKVPALLKPPPKAAPVLVPGQPGIMPLARSNAASIVQTSMAAVAAAARRATFQANSDIIVGLMQVSTLDSHTSLTCIAYSGAQWDLEYKPINGTTLPFNGGVPRHFNCRSSEVAIMKTLRQMGIDMDEPDPGQRASSSGPISAKTTFADYLKMKGEAYQNEVLGPGRAELFRAGKLSPRDLVDQSGRPLKLDELRAKYDGREFKQPQGKFTVYDATAPRVQPDVSTPARAQAVKIEESVRHKPDETGSLIAADGRVMFQRTGLPNSVRVPGPVLEGGEGATFTHNHPGGTSFSAEDVSLAAEYKFGEMRVVTALQRFSMQPIGDWPLPEEIESAYNAIERSAMLDVHNMVTGGELDARFKGAESMHVIWTRVSDLLKMKYTRENS